MKTSLTLPPLSRRRFLQGLGLAGLISSAPALTRAQAPAVTKSGGGKARNIIFMVADGMNMGTLSLANYYRRAIHGKETTWLSLYQERPIVRALMETCSASSLVTDSAAAASAWGCGVRVPNRSINYDSEGKARTPLHLHMKEHGKKTGLVSTARITHATPAGFAANVPHRDDEDTIAEQYLAREVDVLLGGGNRHFKKEKRQDERDLYTDYEKGGYQVVKSRGELMKAKGKGRLLGTFSDTHMPFTVDRDNSAAIAEAVPTLAEMSQVALDRLADSQEGFLLQIEAARVDHAGHANDPVAILHDQLAFDAAIDTVLAWVDGRNDTLVIITTDHGTGGLHVNGAGESYNGTPKMIEALSQASASFEVMAEKIPADHSPEAMTAFIQKHHGVTLVPEDARKLADFLQSPVMKTDYGPRKLGNLMGSILGDYFAVGWTTGNHTGDLVEMAAFGPGAEAINPMVRNNEMFAVVTHAMGVTTKA